MREVKLKEVHEADERRKRTLAIIAKEAVAIERRLRSVPLLETHLVLRESIAQALAPYVHAQRNRAVSAFARVH